MVTTDNPEFNFLLEFFRNLNIFHDLLSLESADFQAGSYIMPVACFANLVYGQSNMHCTLAHWPAPPQKNYRVK